MSCSIVCEAISPVLSATFSVRGLLAVILLLVAAYLLNYRLRMCARLSLYYRPTVLSKYILENTPELTKKVYFPTIYLVSGHLHTLFTELTNRRVAGRLGYGYRRELVKLDDGGQIALDWALLPPENVRRVPDNQLPLIVIMAGLTGGCYNFYVGHIIRHAAKRGFRCVVLNKRGCAGTPLLVFPRIVLTTIDAEALLRV